MLKYRPEIDGLRALAVLSVIFYHAGFNLFKGGYVGVDVFFVVSGFLITSIILNEVENKCFSILDFYERRARRILPALFSVMLVCTPMAWLVLEAKDLQSFFKSLYAIPTFTANIFFWKDLDYFATASELKPFIHTCVAAATSPLETRTLSFSSRWPQRREDPPETSSVWPWVFQWPR